MLPMSNKTLEELDELIREHRGEVEIYSRISPENSGEERKNFEDQLKGEIPTEVKDPVVDELTRDTVARNISPDSDIPLDRLDSENLENPEFRYEDRKDFSEREKEFDRLERELENLDVSEAVKSVYRDSITESRELSRIASGLGDSRTVQEASSRIYGQPSESTLRWAEEVLQEVEPSDDPRYTEGRFRTAEMTETLEKALDLVGMEEWEVDTREKGSVKVNAANQEVSVPEGRKFSENEMMRLLVHEIGTHALRGANGYEQSMEIFGAGTGGYHQAGEGLALFLEQATGLSNPNTLRKYAGRVKSVESVMEGDEFVDTYTMNRELGFSHEKAWNMSLRAHRGGGFIKDHIYGEGLRQVNAYVREMDELEDSDGLEEFARMDGSLQDLMAGKVSVKQGYELQGDLDTAYSPLELIENMDELVPEGVDTSALEVDPGLEELYSGE